MKRAAVLMSTYNGRRFLREQLESIFRQEGVRTDLYVRDDGSTDGTAELLAEYAGRITLLAGENLGVGGSFMELLYRVPPDYDLYCFADQDDIWLPDKLEAAGRQIGAAGAGPVLYGSNQIITDSTGSRQGLRYHDAPDCTWRQVLCGNRVSGCTMVWNPAFQEILREEKRRPSPELLRIRIHDAWVAMAAAVCGTVLYDPEGHILYRQHGDNVVGLRTNGLLQMIRIRLSGGRVNVRSRMAEEILTCFGDLIRDGEIRECLRRYADYRRDRSLKKALLKDRSLLPYSGESGALFRLKVLLGEF